MIHYYTEVLKKYAVFSGRARRAEYWYFILANIIIGFVLGALQGFLQGFTPGIAPVVGFVMSAYWLTIIIPSLAVSVRRLHDTDKSGWWLLIALIPLVGAIILIVFYATDSTPGDNRFGPNPKGVGASTPPPAPPPSPAPMAPPAPPAQPA